MKAATLAIAFLALLGISSLARAVQTDLSGNSSVPSSLPDGPPLAWQYASLISPIYKVYWNLVNNKADVYMRLEANHTAGYVGIGFGPTNTTKMGGTDYYVAYKPSGSNSSTPWTMQDMWASGNDSPQLDSSFYSGATDDIKNASVGTLTSGGRNVIWFQFERPAKATGSGDRPLNMTEGAPTIINWGHHPTSASWSFHPTNYTSIIKSGIRYYGASAIIFNPPPPCPNACNNASAQGQCVNDICVCASGFSGIDCGAALPTGNAAGSVTVPNSAFKLEWNFTGSVGTFTATVTGQQTYVSVGFQPDVGMVNGDCITGTWGGTSGWLVEDYWSTGNTFPAVDTAAGGQRNLISASLQYTGGNTVMTFTRDLTSTDKVTDRDIYKDSKYRVIWAYAPSASGTAYVQHSAATRGLFTVDWWSASSCLNNCNGNGACNAGVCSCNAGFAGGDCSVVIPPPPPANSFPSAYSKSVNLAPTVLLEWVPYFPNTSMIALKVTIKTQGYVSLGWGMDDLGMLNSDMVIAPVAGGYVIPYDYWSNNTVLSPIKDPQQDIIGQGGLNGTHVWMEFVRPIVSTDKSGYDRDFITTDLNKITWANGDIGAISQHSATARGFLWVDLFSTGKCPLSCSGHGTCTSGVCSCTSGYIGVDCATKLNVPVTFPAIYPNSLRLSPTFKLLWSAINTSWVAIRCEAVSNGGYVSVGFGPDDLGMTNADNIIGTINSGFVVDYWSPGLVTPVLDTTRPSGVDNLLYNGGINGTTVWMEFYKQVSPTDPNDRPISTTGLTKVTWAWGDIPSLSQHSVTARGFSYVDFFSSGACPNNCSNHGSCAAGVCTCNANYLGVDCSIYNPPSTITFPTTYAKSHTFNPTFTLSWTVVNNSWIVMKCEGASNGNYISIGFGPDDVGMLNADNIIGTITSGFVIVEDYWSPGLVTPVLDTTVGGKESIKALSSGGISGNTVWMAFYKEVSPADTKDRPIITNGLTKVTWAYGATPSLSQHTQLTRGFAYIDFFSTGACPNNCNSQGSCAAGVCTCNAGYIGIDCGVLVPSPIAASNFPTTYANTKVINPSVNIKWQVIPGNTKVAFRMEINATSWISLGFGSDWNDGMTNGDYVLCAFTGTTLICDDYWSRGLATPSTDTYYGGTNDIIARAGTSGSSTWMEFVRNVSVTDAFDHPLNTTDLTSVQWAYGVTQALSQHDGNTRGKLWLDIFNVGVCPLNCNGRGTCNAGVCSCVSGYVGLDCSIFIPGIGSSNVSFPAAYSHSAVIVPGFTVSWQVISGANAVAFKVTRQGRGWIGLGFGALDLGMSGCDMAIATIYGSTIVVDDYFTFAYSKPTADSMLGTGNSFMISRGSVDSSTTTMEFVRHFTGGDSFDNDILQVGANIVSWATGDTDDLSRHPADVSYRNHFMLDLSSNTIVRPSQIGNTTGNTPSNPTPTAAPIDSAGISEVASLAFALVAAFVAL